MTPTYSEMYAPAIWQRSCTINFSLCSSLSTTPIGLPDFLHQLVTLDSEIWAFRTQVGSEYHTINDGIWSSKSTEWSQGRRLRPSPAVPVQLEFFCVGESIEIQGSHIFEKNNDTMMLGGRSSLSKGSYVSHRYGNWLPADSRWELCLNKRLLPKAKGRRAETSLKIQWQKALFRFGALDLQLHSPLESSDGMISELIWFNFGTGGGVAIAASRLYRLPLARNRVSHTCIVQECKTLCLFSRKKEFPKMRGVPDVRPFQAFLGKPIRGNFQNRPASSEVTWCLDAAIPFRYGAGCP